MECPPFSYDSLTAPLTSLCRRYSDSVRSSFFCQGDEISKISYPAPW